MSDLETNGIFIPRTFHEVNPGILFSRQIIQIIFFNFEEIFIHNFVTFDKIFLDLLQVYSIDA